MPTPALRAATEADLPRVVELIYLGTAPGVTPVEDPGRPLPVSYLEGFRDITRYPGAALMVAELDGVVVGCFLFMLLPHIANRGLPIAQVESVHVHPDHRSKGLGEHMIRWALDRARESGCQRLQLTSNKSRTDAHRFYERLGFAKSHEGFKYEL